VYTGHVAIALAARGLRRDVPLWMFVVASQVCDWIELFVHRMTPSSTPDLYSHGLPFVLVPAGLLATAVWAWKRSLGAAASVLAVCLSHPVADLATGFKPLWLGGPSVGLGLVQRPIADLVTQSLLCIVCVAIYARSLPPWRRRLLAASAPLAFLLALQAGADGVRAFRVRHRRASQTAIVEKSELRMPSFRAER